MRVLAIDPGNTTGVAEYDSEHLSEPIASWEQPNGLAGIVLVLASLREYDLVVVEDFIIRPDTYRKTREPAAYEGLGYVKGWCLERGVTCLVVGAGEHKGFNGKGKASKVRRIGWVTSTTTDGHAEDACSLLLHGIKLYWPPHAVDLLKDIAIHV